MCGSSPGGITRGWWRNRPARNVLQLSRVLKTLARDERAAVVLVKIAASWQTPRPVDQHGQLNRQSRSVRPRLPHRATFSSRHARPFFQVNYRRAVQETLMHFVAKPTVKFVSSPQVETDANGRPVGADRGPDNVEKVMRIRKLLCCIGLVSALASSGCAACCGKWCSRPTCASFPPPCPAPCPTCAPAGPVGVVPAAPAAAVPAYSSPAAAAAPGCCP
jgi:hypothetical protein